MTEKSTAETEYESTARWLGIFGEKVLRAPIPEAVIEKWKTLLLAVKVVDNKIDDTRDRSSRAALSADIVKFINGQDIDFSADAKFEKALRTVCDLGNGLPPQERGVFLKTLTRILEVTESIKQEKKVGKFIRLTDLEGALTAQLFPPFLRAEYKEHPKFAALESVFIKLGRIGNLYDTYRDLADDYAKGETRIHPTFWNRARVIGSALLKTPGLLIQVRPPRKLVQRVIAVRHPQTAH